MAGFLATDRKTLFARGKLLGTGFLQRFKCGRDDSISTNEIPPFACKFNPTGLHGNLLAVVDEEGYVQLLDTRKPAHECLVKDWAAHKNAIFDTEWSNDNRLATASGDTQILLWDVHDNSVVNRFKGHQSSVKSLNVHRDNPDLFVSGSRDGCIMIWDTRITPKGGYQHPTNIIKDAHRMPSSNNGATSTKATRRINKESSSSPCSKKTTDVTNGVTSVLFHQDHFIASVGASDGVVKLWDTRCLYTHLKQTPPTCYHAFNYLGLHGFTSLISDPYQSKLYASCKNDIIYEYDSIRLKKDPINYFVGHKTSSFYVKSTLSYSGRFLLSGSSCGNGFIWDTENPLDPPTLLIGHEREVTAVSWAPYQLDKIVTCSDNCDLNIWRADVKEEIGTVSGYSRKYDGLEYEKRLKSLSANSDKEGSSPRNVLQPIHNNVQQRVLKKRVTPPHQESSPVRLKRIKTTPNSNKKRTRTPLSSSSTTRTRTILEYMIL